MVGHTVAWGFYLDPKSRATFARGHTTLKSVTLVDEGVILEIQFEDRPGARHSFDIPIADLHRSPDGGLAWEGYECNIGIQ